MLLSDLLKQMIDLKASDIFVVAGLPLTGAPPVTGIPVMKSVA